MANHSVERSIGNTSVSAEKLCDARELTGRTFRPCLRAKSSAERSIGNASVSATKPRGARELGCKIIESQRFLKRKA